MDTIETLWYLDIKPINEYSEVKMKVKKTAKMRGGGMAPQKMKGGGKVMKGKKKKVKKGKKKSVKKK